MSDERECCSRHADTRAACRRDRAGPHRDGAGGFPRHVRPPHGQAHHRPLFPGPYRGRRHGRLRVPADRRFGHGASLRIECRIPGADANPYLAYAATIAAGLDGISNRIEPPPIFQGNVYQAADLPQVPRTLREAIGELERSALAREAFGTDVVEHYLHFLTTEQRKFDEAVTCWERARFFERA